MDSLRWEHLSRTARRWTPPLACALVVGLVGLQALAYATRMHLSLGPHVIMQPWLMRQGYVIYQDIVEQHTPFLPLLLAAILPLFADARTMAQVVQVALLSITTTLAFAAAVRRAGWIGGLWAALFVVLWSPWFDYGKLWHESLLAPLYALLLWVYDPNARRRAPWSVLLLGLLGGTAVMVKQHAIVVLAALVGWHALAGRWNGRPWRALVRDVLLLGCGALVPLLAFVVYQVVRAGTLHRFLYWTLVYNVTGSYRTMAAQLPTARQALLFAVAGLLVPAAVLYAFERWRARDRVWLDLGWGTVLLAASSATVYPRFDAFHLQAALPLLACLSALVVATALRRAREGRAFVLTVAVSLTLLWSVAAAPRYAQIHAAAQRPIAEYTELLPLAQEVMQHAAPGDTLFLYPDDEGLANLYYLTGRLPPKPWICTYPWFMVGWVRADVMAHLRDQPPDWIVHFPQRWAIESHTPEIVAHIDSHYRPVAELALLGETGWLLERRP